MTVPLRFARCLCGLRMILHFAGTGMAGRKLTCAETAQRHPYAICKCPGYKIAIARSAFAFVRRAR